MEKIKCNSIFKAKDGGSIVFECFRETEHGEKMTFDNLNNFLVEYVINYNISDKGTDKYGRLFKQTKKTYKSRGKNKISKSKNIVKDPKELERLYNSVLEYNSNSEYVGVLKELISKFGTT